MIKQYFFGSKLALVGRPQTTRRLVGVPANYYTITTINNILLLITNFYYTYYYYSLIYFY